MHRRPRYSKKRRKLPKNRGYRPAGEPVGYDPPLRTRKAPHAYWRRSPYPDGYGTKGTGRVQPLPPGNRRTDDDWWDEWSDPVYA